MKGSTKKSVVGTEWMWQGFTGMGDGRSEDIRDGDSAAGVER